MKIYVWMLLTIFLCSCGLGENVFSRKYVLENGTGRELKIDFYAYGRYRDSGYIIGTGTIFEGVTDDQGRGKLLNPSFAGGSDSIIVTYDNTKRQIYTRISRADYMNISPDSGNILFDSVYNIENDELYRYTFTEEDYENAEIMD